ncbi:MAG: ATP-binding protein, partial [Acidobacteriota bacterium]
QQRERMVERRGSGRVFDVEVTPVFAEDESEPSGAVALFMDVTRLERLESVRQQFIANVSHELRTPLTAIKAYVETAEEELDASGTVSRRFLEKIDAHATRMTALIDDLIDLSRIETGAIQLEPTRVRLAESARQVLSQLEPRHRLGEGGRDVSVSIEIEPTLEVVADPLRLEQILSNLIDNAIKFNRPGGNVTIRAEQQPDRTMIIVEDEGEGILSEDLEKIFHRFYQVDPARSPERRGTGLGLSIVKHLTQLHGGSVRCESELGRGAKFIVELPPRASVARTARQAIVNGTGSR